MLELRPNCEACDVDLPPASADARICSYECTFCARCVEQVLHNVCPNCGGGFAPRPVRPAVAHRPGVGLQFHPASTVRVHSDCCEAESQGAAAPAAPGFGALACERSVVVQAVKIALLVGTVLALINHGRGIVTLSLSQGSVLQILLTYLVPYAVSTYSSVRALQRHALENPGQG